MPEGAISLGPGRHGAGARARGRRARRRRAAGPARRAAAALAARARGGAGAARARARASRRSAASSASSARASRRSRGRSRRPAASRRASTATICARDFEIHVDLFGPADDARGRAARAARAAPLQRGRARRSRRSCSSSARARLDARDRGVVHGRHGRRAADVGARLERRLPRLGRRVRGRGEGARARRAARDARAARRGLRRDGGGDGRRRAGAARRGRRGRGDGRRRARRRARRRSRSGSSTCTPRRPRRRAAIEFTYGQDRDSIRRRATVAALHLVAAASDTEPCTKPRDDAPLASKAMRRVRLFCGLRLPDDALDALVAWQREHSREGRIVPRDNLHVTLAFLGRQPRARRGRRRRGAARRCAEHGAVRSFELVRYRETRSVGMLVFTRRRRRASGSRSSCSATCSARRRERETWLPHVTVLRFRERPRLRPPLPELGPVVPSEAAAYLSVLRPAGAEYVVLESVHLGG